MDLTEQNYTGHLENLNYKLHAIKAISNQLIKDSLQNGTLTYYHDPQSCKSDELVKIEDKVETIIKRDSTE